METQQKKRAPISIVATHAGDVVVYGGELIGKTALYRLATILNALAKIDDDGDHGIASVAFSTSTPKGMVADCNLDTAAITINLMETFGKSFEVCLDKEKQGAMAISFLFWHNVYVSYIHESLHIRNPEAPEKEIENTAIAILFALAKELNLEPGESRFVMEQMNELIANDRGDKFIVAQKAMWEAGESFTNGKVRLTSYHDFAHLFSGADDKDPEWNQKPKNSFIPVKEVVVASPTPGGVPQIIEVAFDPDPVAIAEQEDELIDPDPELEWLDRLMREERASKVDTKFVMPAELVYHHPANMADEDFRDFDNAIPPDFDESMEAETEEEFEAAYYAISGITPSNTPAVAPTPAVAYTPAQAPVTVSLVQNSAPEKVAALSLPRTGLTPERTAEIMMGIYTRCFNQIFGTCGQLLNSDKGFAYPGGVLSPIPLSEEEQRVVVGFFCHINGKWSEVSGQNYIHGFVGGIKNLPTYKLIVNMDGVKFVRLVLPQNPAKMHGAYLSPKAALARKGIAIVYIMEGDDAAKNAGAKQWLYKAVIERTNLNTPAVATVNSWQEC